MMTFRVFATVYLSLTLIGAVLVSAGDNPPLPGFDQSGSDPRAISVADETMDSMGGRAAWDGTRCIGWTIFGRNHVWDKWTGDYRVEEEETVTIMNVHTKEGRVWEGGAEVTGDAAAEKLARAHSIWINDSYWLVMPYKLKDSGVTLGYKGLAKTEDGRDADVLVLTFDSIGETPKNKYDVYVDSESRLVSQWAYYRDASDEEPRFVTPWTDWTRFGDVLIPLGRGEREVTGVSVHDAPPAGAFEGP